MYIIILLTKLPRCKLKNLIISFSYVSFDHDLEIEKKLKEDIADADCIELLCIYFASYTTDDI